MKRFIFAVAVGAFALGVALGPAAPQGAPAPGTCESKAVSKAGKQLAGAAKNSFMAKCKREACAPKAVGAGSLTTSLQTGRQVDAAAAA